MRVLQRAVEAATSLDDAASRSSGWMVTESMKRYSYMVGCLDNGWGCDAEQAQLNKMGQMGWELVAVVTKTAQGKPCTVYYFRREQEEQ